MRWCMDDEEPECNGPDCGHADNCPFYMDLMDEDDTYKELLEKFNKKKEGGLK